MSRSSSTSVRRSMRSSRRPRGRACSPTTTRVSARRRCRRIDSRPLSAKKRPSWSRGRTRSAGASWRRSTCGSWTDTVLWVRFRHDQGTDRVSFSLFNPASGKFGRAAAPGSSQRLGTSSATVYFGESAVLGPPGRDVTLRVRFSVKPRTAGGVYRVEAFATDDNGHSQGFDRVGTGAERSRRSRARLVGVRGARALGREDRAIAHLVPARR